MPRTYEQLLFKFQEDPAFEKKFKERKIYLQRIRFHNPIVREKHRLACIAWKEKSIRPSVPVSIPEIFSVEFV